MSADLDNNGTPKFDHFPWSDEDEAAYQEFATELDELVYQQQLKDFEDDGGDVSMEIEDGLIPDPRETATEAIVESELSPMQKRILDEWKEYP